MFSYVHYFRIPLTIQMWIVEGSHGKANIHIKLIEMAIHRPMITILVREINRNSSKFNDVDSLSFLG